MTGNGTRWIIDTGRGTDSGFGDYSSPYSWKHLRDANGDLYWFSTESDARKVAAALNTASKEAFYSHGYHDQYDGDYPVEYKAVQMPPYRDESSDADDMINYYISLNRNAWIESVSVDDYAVAVTHANEITVSGASNYDSLIKGFNQECMESYGILGKFDPECISKNIFNDRSKLTMRLSYMPYLMSAHDYSAVVTLIYVYNADTNTLEPTSFSTRTDPWEFGHDALRNSTDARALKALSSYLDESSSPVDEDLVFIGAVDQQGVIDDEYDDDHALGEVYSYHDDVYVFAPDDFTKDTIISDDYDGLRQQLMTMIGASRSYEKHDA
jgi:hypothetical protein